MEEGLCAPLLEEEVTDLNTAALLGLCDFIQLSVPPEIPCPQSLSRSICCPRIMRRLGRIGAETHHKYLSLVAGLYRIREAKMTDSDPRANEEVERIAVPRIRARR